MGCVLNQGTLSGVVLNQGTLSGVRLKSRYSIWAVSVFYTMVVAVLNL